MAFDKTATEFLGKTCEGSQGSGFFDVAGSPVFWAAKRAFDIVVSLMLLPVLAVFGLALLVLNPFFNRGPLIFRQTRMGRFCEPFTAVKFRSMLPAENISRKADDPLETNRITPLGVIIRKLRIDELPQLINVLRGEMSLIGPRPDTYVHAVDYLHAIPEYRARHVVRPGISGFAQVTLGYAEGVVATQAKAAADLSYVRNAGFALEAKIVWLTFVTVFNGRGA
jgi:lipopolysaccharide/colanic/teichoic acid biosynthesis glycosyltransferase